MPLAAQHVVVSLAGVDAVHVVGQTHSRDRRRPRAGRRRRTRRWCRMPKPPSIRSRAAGTAQDIVPRAAVDHAHPVLDCVRSGPKNPGRWRLRRNRCGRRRPDPKCGTARPWACRLHHPRARYPAAPAGPRPLQRHCSPGSPPPSVPGSADRP